MIQITLIFVIIISEMLSSPRALVLQMINLYES